MQATSFVRNLGRNLGRNRRRNLVKGRSRLDATRAGVCVALSRPGTERVLRVAFALFLMLVVLPTQPACDSSSGIAKGLGDLAKLGVDALIVVGGIALVLGGAFNSVGGMVATAVGSPNALSHTWMRIIGMVVCFVILVFTIPLANAFIDVLMASRPSEPIHIDRLTGGGGAPATAVPTK